MYVCSQNHLRGWCGFGPCVVVDPVLGKSSFTIFLLSSVGEGNVTFNHEHIFINNTSWLWRSVLSPPPELQARERGDKE